MPHNRPSCATCKHTDECATCACTRNRCVSSAHAALKCTSRTDLPDCAGCARGVECRAGACRHGVCAPTRLAQAGGAKRIARLSFFARSVGHSYHKDEAASRDTADEDDYERLSLEARDIENVVRDLIGEAEDTDYIAKRRMEHVSRPDAMTVHWASCVALHPFPDLASRYQVSTHEHDDDSKPMDQTLKVAEGDGKVFRLETDIHANDKHDFKPEGVHDIGDKNGHNFEARVNMEAAQEIKHSTEDAVNKTTREVHLDLANDDPNIDLTVHGQHIGSGDIEKDDKLLKQVFLEAMADDAKSNSAQFRVAH